MFLKELERLGKQKRKHSTHPQVVVGSGLLSHDGGMAELGGERDGRAEREERDGRVERGERREMAELSRRCTNISEREAKGISTHNK